ASELSEEVRLGSVMFGHESFQPVIDAIVSLAESAAKEPWPLPAEVDTSDVKTQLEALVGDDLKAAYAERDKQARTNLLSEARKKVDQAAAEDDNLDASVASGVFKKMEKSLVRGQILDSGVRIDGRDTKTVRPIVAENDVLPRTHGSALFTRGETQALAVTTLGTGQDEQMIDALEGEYRERFMLHYNFPPYSTGETKFMASPGRREI
ncbi:unnamed protein product, partial [Laminaria digitata]